MNLKNLLEKHEPKKIVNRLLELYPDDKPEGYLVVIDELLATVPEESDSSIIDIRHISEDGDEWEDVGLFNGKECMSGGFTPWAQWLAFEIKLGDYSELDFLAHVLWDMTFYGFSDQAVQVFAGEMGEEVSEAEEALERGEMDKFIGLDEMMERLNGNSQN